MKNFYIILIAIFIAVLGASAQDIKPISGKVKDGYNFWLSTPKHVEASPEKKPLVVFLHGASLKGNNLNKVLRYGTMDAIKKGLDIDAYVIAPQTASCWSPAKVMNTVDYVLKHNPGVDSTRVYVIGMSLGGYGTLDVAATYPHRIAAAMALCGGASVKNVANLNQLPLWIIHGTADRAVSIAESDKVVAKMRADDSKTSRLIYNRIPGMNHSQPARLFYLPQTYKWLFSHSLDDDNRKVNDGFNVNNNTLSGAYKKIKSERVTVASALATHSNNAKIN